MTYEFEFLTPETRVMRLNTRIAALEDELANCQMNLEIDGAGSPDNEAVMTAHKNALQIVAAKIEAAKWLRADANKEIKERSSGSE